MSWLKCKDSVETNAFGLVFQPQIRDFEIECIPTSGSNLIYGIILLALLWFRAVVMKINHISYSFSVHFCLCFLGKRN